MRSSLLKHTRFRTRLIVLNFTSNSLNELLYHSSRISLRENKNDVFNTILNDCSLNSSTWYYICPHLNEFNPLLDPLQQLLSTALASKCYQHESLTVAKRIVSVYPNHAMSCPLFSNIIRAAGENRNWNIISDWVRLKLERQSNISDILSESSDVIDYILEAQLYLRDMPSLRELLKNMIDFSFFIQPSSPIVFQSKMFLSCCHAIKKDPNYSSEFTELFHSLSNRLLSLQVSSKISLQNAYIILCIASKVDHKNRVVDVIDSYIGQSGDRSPITETDSDPRASTTATKGISQLVFLFRALSYDAKFWKVSEGLRLYRRLLVQVDKTIHPPLEVLQEVLNLCEVGRSYTDLKQVLLQFDLWLSTTMPYVSSDEKISLEMNKNVNEFLYNLLRLFRSLSIPKSQLPSLLRLLKRHDVRGNERLATGLVEYIYRNSDTIVTNDMHKQQILARLAGVGQAGKLNVDEHCNINISSMRALMELAQSWSTVLSKETLAVVSTGWLSERIFGKKWLSSDEDFVFEMEDSPFVMMRLWQEAGKIDVASHLSIILETAYRIGQLPAVVNYLCRIIDFGHTNESNSILRVTAEDSSCGSGSEAAEKGSPLVPLVVHTDLPVGLLQRGMSMCAACEYYPGVEMLFDVHVRCGYDSTTDVLNTVANAMLRRPGGLRDCLRLVQTFGSTSTSAAAVEPQIFRHMWQGFAARKDISRAEAVYAILNSVSDKSTTVFSEAEMAEKENSVAYCRMLWLLQGGNPWRGQLEAHLRECVSHLQSKDGGTSREVVQQYLGLLLRDTVKLLLPQDWDLAVKFSRLMHRIGQPLPQSTLDLLVETALAQDRVLAIASLVKELEAMKLSDFEAAGRVTGDMSLVESSGDGQTALTSHKDWVPLQPPES